MNDDVAAFENGPGYKTPEEDSRKHRGARGQNRREETPEESNRGTHSFLHPKIQLFNHLSFSIYYVQCLSA